jgi:hypothetical protein
MKKSILLLSGLLTFPVVLTGGTVDDASSPLYVSKYKIELDRPPSRVPTNWNTDAPILGNGDLGVIVGGPADNPQFWFSKCDFWRAKPLYPWFTPALIGHLGLKIPALQGASFHTEQRLDTAEMLQTFATPETTVHLRSWTPATENALIVELSCTGKPVGVDLSSSTRSGYGSTVETGIKNDTLWLTRSFTGPEMDWPNQATLAVRSPGVTFDPAPRPPVEPASDTLPLEVGRAQYPGESGFAGRIANLEIFDQALGDAQVRAFSQPQTPPLPPVAHWALDRVDESGHDVTMSEGPTGPALHFSGKEGSYVDLGPHLLPVRPLTISAWLYADGFNERETNEIAGYGDADHGVRLRLANGVLRMESGGKFAQSEETIPLNQWVHVVGTDDGRHVELYMDGLSISSFPVEAGTGHLTLSPDHPVLIVATVSTNHETPAFQDKALAAAQEIDPAGVEQLRQKHRAWWHSFWKESMVEIGDPLLEKYYYGSFYLMACCSRNEAFPPALFGNLASDDRPWMGGDYHMNYNYQAPWWGCYIANHIGLTNPYDTPILQFMEHGKMMAHNYLGKKGVLYSVGIGPLGSSSDWTKPHHKWADDSEDKHFLAGQKSNASFCAINMIMRWRMTYDLNYARKVYPFLLEVANFWEDYLVYENGRYVDYHDSVQEWSGDDMNAIQTLGLIRGVFETVIDMSTQLDVDQTRRAKWQDILDKLSGYSFQKVGAIKSSDVNPDFLKDPANLNKTVFRYSEKGFPWSPDCTLGIQHIYPAGAFGLDSSPEMLEIARNTVSALGRWSDDNHTMTLYPAAARVGYDPEILLQHLREQCLSPDHGFPNLVLNYGGGGIETCSTVTATINEMLLQSHQGVLRLFADWPKNRDARFETLRGYGAFLVTAAQKGGVVGPVTITSEKGRDCTVVNPWPGRAVELVRPDHATNKVSGERFTFKTSPGETVRLEPL